MIKNQFTFTNAANVLRKKFIVLFYFSFLYDGVILLLISVLSVITIVCKQRVPIRVALSPVLSGTVLLFRICLGVLPG